MKVKELISLADEIKKNEIGVEIKLRYLNDVEGRIFCEIYKNAPERFKEHVSLEEEMSLPVPYSRMYILYLLALISFAEHEYDAYKNMMVEHEKVFCEYSKYYMRNKQNM